MKQWIVRYGSERRLGPYLWTMSYVPPTPDYGIGSIGGGFYKRSDEAGRWVAEWDESQRGAERFDRIDKAARAAKRVGGRVVALRATSPAKEEP